MGSGVQGACPREEDRQAGEKDGHVALGTLETGRRLGGTTLKPTVAIIPPPLGRRGTLQDQRGTAGGNEMSLRGLTAPARARQLLGLAAALACGAALAS